MELISLDKISLSDTYGNLAMGQSACMTDLEDLRERLKTQGGFILGTEYGRLVVTDIKHLIGAPALLIAFEGSGAAVYEFDRPLNPFRLMAKGFPNTAAEQVALLVNSLFWKADSNPQIGN